MKVSVYLKYMVFSESSFDEGLRKYGEKWPWEADPFIDL